MRIRIFLVFFMTFIILFVMFNFYLFLEMKSFNGDFNFDFGLGFEVYETIEIVDGEARTSTEEYQELWEDIIEFDETGIVEEYVVELVIFTDGKRDTLAAVEQVSVLEDEWSLMIDINDLYNLAGNYTTESIYTLHHEIFHIISLNNEQTSIFSCSDCVKIEGYWFYEDSYIAEFTEEFWTEEDLEIASENSDGYVSEIYDEDEFVSEYASTSVFEDMAESYSFYKTDSCDSFDSSTTSYDKCTFFERYPEFD